MLAWQLSSRKCFPALTSVCYTGTVLSPVVARITVVASLADGYRQHNSIQMPRIKWQAVA